MVHETPVLEKNLEDYTEYGNCWGDCFICTSFVKRHFKVVPERITITVSNRVSKDAVALDIQRVGGWHIVKWGKPDTKRLQGAMYSSMAEWLIDNDIATEKRRTVHVSVNIVED